MAPADTLSDPTNVPARRRLQLWPKKWRWRLSLLALIALIVFGGAIWTGRERIAGNLIDNALAENGLEASYEIVEIGPQRQVIANLVVGDPAMPDLTAERVNVDIAYSFGTPGIGRVELVRPRIYGEVRDGRLSFGALDPLIYAESDAPPAMPALDLAIIDGRARIASEYGVIGAKLDGEGRLDGGFEGILAATAPGVGNADCRAGEATLYGAISVENGEPIFDGPVRLREVACAGASLASADIAARVGLTEDFGSLQGDFGIEAARASYGETAAEALGGRADLLWRFAGEEEGTTGPFSLRHDIAASDVTSAYASLGDLSAEGDLRLSDNFTRSDWNARVSGERIGFAPDLAVTLDEARAASAGTLAQSLLAKLDRGLTSALANGRMSGDVTVRTNPDGWRVIVPEARLRSGAGETVLALSRVSYGGQGRNERLTGNFLTGGTDLPRINGRMEQAAGGALAMRMTMAEFRAGGDALAIPRLELRQEVSGRLAFNGMLQAEGALPGGGVRGLEMPLEGTWSQRSGLAMGTSCANVRLAGLELYQLSLTERRIRLCPEAGRAMLSGRDAIELAVVSEGLELAGELGGSPAAITAQRAVLRYPGPFAIDGLTAVIGAPDNALRLAATQLTGELGESIGGTFTGGDAALDIVPLNLSRLSGTWGYADGVLSIGEGAFTLTERLDPANGPDARFEPLTARGATLTLANGAIRANADLRHPASGSLVTSIAIRHDLSTSAGRADIAVPGVRFTDNFQPEDLSIFTKGVIADAKGTITGAGEVTWNADSIDSSGTFRTDDFDFAAAFGPVRGIRGAITFTDLLGLTTAPSQVLEVGSVNTGIEALGGRLTYSLTGGEVITIEDGRWPFMGGTLILRPVTINYGASGGQSYVFEIVELDAATFVAQMELTNIGATGTFDGAIPIHFDEEGNGSIRGGLLISRPPGGNVSYVGELTYEDMGAMANYAFQSLRSLDYRQMSVELNGSLAGEIITNFQIDGVRQGEGASRNFVTRRLAKLPIRFKINVRSENFYQLATIVRGLFDPTLFDTEAARDGLNLRGLLQSGGALVPLAPFARHGEETPPEPPPDTPPENPSEPRDVQRRDESAVQPPESD